MSSKTLFRALEEDMALLPCPEAASRVMEVSGSPNATAADLEGIIERDPALCAKILKIANSAYYGVRQQVNQVRQAVVLLGFRTTRNIAVGVALSGWMKRDRHVGRIDANDLWRHSLRVGVTAGVLARQGSGDVNTDDAFLGGLLHDLGVLAEFEVCPEELERVMQMRDADDVSHVEAELAVLGVDHCRATATLLRRWSFPKELREGASHHHAYETMGGALTELGTVVAQAETLCAGVGMFSDGVPVEQDEVCARLMIEPDQLPRLQEQIAERWETAKSWGEGA